MKNREKRIKWYAWLGLFASIVGTLEGFTGQSFYLTRPQGVYAARELVGWQTLVNKSDMCSFYGAISVAPTYMASFNSKRIADFLFGSSLLTFSGSRSPNRGSQDILADYFGLPSDYKSQVCFDPHIANFIMDLDFYFGLDDLVQGLYVRVHAPITHTGWDLKLREFINVPGVAFQPAGYMSATRINRNDLSEDLVDYMCGLVKFGDMQEPLKYGKICGRATKNRIAEIFAAVGWNVTDENYHAGLNFRFGIPTSNRAHGELLFEPIAGNGHHWEVGVGFTAHYDLWHSCDDRDKLGVYFDANITHLCNATQLRSFDLKKNGPGSRYMLLEQIGSPSNNLFLGAPDGPAAPNQYIRRLLPAINVTTLETKISFDIQADLAIKLSYQRQGLDIDFGYNFWSRSKEKLHCRALFPSNQFAVKGDAQVYGFDGTTAPVTPIPLNATQSNATLHAGQGSGNGNFQNLNADSPVIAADSATNLNNLTPADATALGLPLLQIVRTSNPAILLQDSDIDCESALLPKASTNSLFMHVGHVWDKGEEFWQPYIGFGAQVEFATGCVQKNCGTSQWAVWLKGGVAF